jgi:hypothetical protein
MDFVLLIIVEISQLPALSRKVTKPLHQNEDEVELRKSLLFQAPLQTRFDAKAWLPFKMAGGTVILSIRNVKTKPLFLPNKFKKYFKTVRGQNSVKSMTSKQLTQIENKSVRRDKGVFKCFNSVSAGVIDFLTFLSKDNTYLNK